MTEDLNLLIKIIDLLRAQALTRDHLERLEAIACYAVDLLLEHSK